MVSAMAGASPTHNLSDRQIFGKSTRRMIVRANPDDPREWLRPGEVCPLLLQHHIGHVGIMRAAPPYEVIRNDQSGTFMLACFGGEGVVLVDGAWKRIKSGQACLLPPFVLNALKCLPGKEWDFAWVRYEESRETAPIVSSVSPVSGTFDPIPLKSAIEGLHAEVSSSSASSALHHWTELIHHYVVRFAQPKHPDDRLWRLWQRVETDLGRSWTLTDLAGIACVSEEHLRRLCRKELGRSPMQHLTFLRLQRARHLLAVTDDKVDTIAKAVGFRNTFAFSNTFKGWMGVRPSEFRRIS
jgi:AraC-like DNA-binding protein